jgi:hypothetical protein
MVDIEWFFKNVRLSLQVCTHASLAIVEDCIQVLVSQDKEYMYHRNNKFFKSTIGT